MSSSQEANTSNLTVTRRERLKQLLMEFTQQQIAKGQPAKGMEQLFAATLQISPSLLSQVKSSRPIGDKLARQIEKACSRPPGYLDELVDRMEMGPTPAEEAFIASAREAWRAANSREKRELGRHLKLFLTGKATRAH